jgi:hypothetical protein
MFLLLKDGSLPSFSGLPLVEKKDGPNTPVRSALTCDCFMKKRRGKTGPDGFTASTSANQRSFRTRSFS